MSVPVDFAAWQRLVSCTVDDCHAAWLPGADAALMAGLRGSARGRRLLARHLATHGATALMRLDGIKQMGMLPECDWMFERGATLRSRVIDLGTLALAPGLRKLVDRSAVQTLRRVLTPERYSWLMACDPDIDSAIADVYQLKGWRLVDRHLDDDTRFMQLVENRGLQEIGGALTGAPALLRDRVRLLFAPGARGSVPDAWLPPGRALRLLRSGGSDAPIPQPLPKIDVTTAEAV
ncbi:MAG: hypothetical protein AB8G16_14385 [Gammaproteobacteria bacterium]